MPRIEKCPIDVAFYKTSLGKKWTLTILRDVILGFNKFSQILKNNQELTSKVLSQRIKELIDEEILIKTSNVDSPVDVHYELSTKGKDLNKVLYELSVFGVKYYPKSVFGDSNITYEEAVEIFGRGFQLPEESIEHNRRIKPNVFPVIQVT
jgi:DNA-binding HxlR family transcriptional regulator